MKPVATVPNQNYNTDVVYVFGLDGKFQSEFGGTFAADGANGYQIKVLTLGTNEDWFVVASRFEKESGFGMVTTVYDVRKPAAALLRFRHRGNDLAMTHSVEEAAGNGPGFTLSPRPEDYETDSRGRLLPPKVVPRIVWDAKARRFFGKKASLNRATAPVYQVDVKQSTAFSATQD